MALVYRSLALRIYRYIYSLKTIQVCDLVFRLIGIQKDDLLYEKFIKCEQGRKESNI